MSIAKQIHTFYSIDILQNSLVLCDIDDTVLVFPKCPKSFYDEFYDYYTRLGYNEEIAKQLVNNDWQLNRYVKKPSITDKEGFFYFLEQVARTNSKLCFITSRSDCFHEKTLNELKHLNIDCTKFPIYYTNASLKGNCIKENIHILDNYKKIIFIDDNDEQLESVKKEFPYVTCYKFIHIDNSNLSLST